MELTRILILLPLATFRIKLGIRVITMIKYGRYLGSHVTVNYLLVKNNRSNVGQSILGGFLKLFSLSNGLDSI